MKKVYVIGAGVVGLSTALCIYERCPEVVITVVADKYSPETTGDGAGGFWQPYMMGDTPEPILRRWGRKTFDHLLHLSQSTEAAESGTFLVTGYDIFHQAIEEPFWKDLVLGYRHLTRRELSLYPGHRFGYQYTTLMAEGKKYLPWLMKRLVKKGCHFIKKRVYSLEEFPDADLVVNCAGLGARQLTGDESLQPMRGQLIRAKAPWIKYFLNADDEDLHVLLGSDVVVLGGTHLLGNDDTTVDKIQSDRIWNGCCKLIPSLKEAKKIEEWVGLRPSRPTVRLQYETIDGNLKVVHNYGHGGGGITLHWGCAEDAADLVITVLSGNVKFSKL